jgi:hypothetical protein
MIIYWHYTDRGYSGLNWYSSSGPDYMLSLYEMIGLWRWSSVFNAMRYYPA